MKKVLIFLFGLVSGVLLTVMVSFIVHRNPPVNDIKLFDEPKECIKTSGLMVFQVFESGEALAAYLLGAVLLLPEEGAAYYDAQIIKIPEDKCLRHIGTYRYEAEDGSIRTVPVARIMSKFKL